MLRRARVSMYAYGHTCVSVFVWGGSLLPFLRPRQKMGGRLSFLFPVSLWALLFLLPTSPGSMSHPIHSNGSLDSISGFTPHQSWTQGFLHA